MLAKKQTIHQVDRPLVHCVIGYLLGIIIGNILHQKMYVSFIMCLIGSLIGLIVYAFYYAIEPMRSILFCIVLGALCFINFSMHQEERYFKSDERYIIHGQISQISTSSFYQWVTLKHVQECETEKSFKNQVKVRLPLSIQNLSPYDEITIEAEMLELTPRMNPSDFNQDTYLKSEAIIATFKSNGLITYQNLLTKRQFLAYKEQTPVIEKIQLKLHEQLERLFTSDTGCLNEQLGIIEACLLGDDSKLNQETKEIYQQAGISHVLCISGFHVGVMISAIVGLIIILSHFCFIPYLVRQVLLIVAIWSYALLTGGAISTIRATQMVTVALIAKCLWQEDDALTNLAIAAFIIVFLNPYQLFRVGFQLSFSAVLGIILCQMQLEKKELQEMKVYTSLQKKGLIWVSIQLFTLPILAYHFYTVPFTLSLLNLIIIPLFAVIIIVSWVLVGLSFIAFPIAKVGVESLIMLLTYIEQGIVLLEETMPLATLCIGKPTLLKYSSYISSVIVIESILWDYWKPKKVQLALAAGSFYVLGSFYQSTYLNQTLKITGLYVGQGDCTVIEMPKYGLFIVDGGNFGKGSTLKSYIQYLGYDKVEGVMISHCDDDHIGGILDLLDTTIEIKHVFLTEDSGHQNFEALIKKCKEEKVSVHYLEKGDTLKYDQVLIECFAPYSDQDYSNSNDQSIVCQLSYQNFKMLFTGDKSIESDQALYKLVKEPITLLKVSHHGSRTGTSFEILSQLQPQYAMISCGINNRYHHPHQEVLNLLENLNVEYNRTDQEGAILYETDGYYLNKVPFRKEI